MPTQGDTKNGLIYHRMKRGSEVWVTPEHFAKLKSSQEQYRKNNKEKISESHKAWAKLNPRDRSNYNSKWRKASERRLKKKRNRRRREKQQEVTDWKNGVKREYKYAGTSQHLRHLVRQRATRRIHLALKAGKYSKTKTTETLVSCSFETLIKHLESQFKTGMTWKTYGVTGWHIDHKIPLASAKTESEMIKLFHYTNLQPLWAKDNLRKNKF